MAYRLMAVMMVTFLAAHSAFAQTDKSPDPQRPFQFNKKWEIPVTAALVAWPLYGMSKVYGRDPVPEAEVMALKISDINKFDRPIADNYDPKAAKTSDLFFYGSMGLPLVLLFDKGIRKDAGQIGLMYLETLGAFGSVYVTSAMAANRFRPYAYNPTVDITKRTRGGARNSFFAGHPGFVASSAFFMAQVYTAYHPQMRFKWAPYAVAGAATVTTGLLRLKAGQHFRSDVIVGTTIGTLSGILIPHFHRNKNYEKQKITLYPSFGEGSNGLTAVYKLGN
ncbi:phosphatase PAP2 family protein [Ferruginibacter sp. HRS2-29]|uniref:phosphatase PAP2 family protein n=1 Tax=Ferruginibacter sp. HRS2-29 TaxID=2487334 RepID=UPI0020CD28DA|nr:phosphatase PAP2 family protein [Ferruginibacter sp. HRS2-29]MCP9749515.1 phosphatase PAP2 family protein [Ferruginibacter sp. HRS2-29]